MVSDSAITRQHVHVQDFGCNPHIVGEEDNDLEVVNEVGVDEDELMDVEVMDKEEDDVGPGSPVSPSTIKRRRKAAKARRN